MLKILLAVDGSECSDRAVDFLITKMQWYREPVELHLLTVHHHLPYGRFANAVEHGALQQFYREEGMKALASARAKLDAAKVAYQHHIGVGEPADIISQYAREKEVDQIVMGSHGLGRVGSMVMGSVTTKLLHVTKVPVLVVT